MIPGGDGVHAPRCEMSRGEYESLAKTVRSLTFLGETVRAVVLKNGEIVNWFEFANDAHDYVQRRHDPDVRILNPEALAA